MKSVTKWVSAGKTNLFRDFVNKCFPLLQDLALNFVPLISLPTYNFCDTPPLTATANEPIWVSCTNGSSAACLPHTRSISPFLGLLRPQTLCSLSRLKWETSLCQKPLKCVLWIPSSYSSGTKDRTCSPRRLTRIYYCITTDKPSISTLHVLLPWLKL